MQFNYVHDESVRAVARVAGGRETFARAETNTQCLLHHSHSIVAGGLLLTSYTTRLMPRTSLMMRVLTRLSTA